MPHLIECYLCQNREKCHCFNVSFPFFLSLSFSASVAITAHTQPCTFISKCYDLRCTIRMVNKSDISRIEKTRNYSIFHQATPLFHKIGNICHPKVIYGMTDARHIKKMKSKNKSTRWTKIRNINICPFRKYMRWKCLFWFLCDIAIWFKANHSMFQASEINFILSRSNVAMQTVLGLLLPVRSINYGERTVCCESKKKTAINRSTKFDRLVCVRYERERENADPKRFLINFTIYGWQWVTQVSMPKSHEKGFKLKNRMKIIRWNEPNDLKTLRTNMEKKGWANERPS